MQAALKLKSIILQKKKPGPLSSGSTEVPELQQLWGLCIDVNPTVCQANVQLLLNLVYSNEADYTYVLNGILNLIPTAKHLSPLISAIGELLILQVLIHEKLSDKPYVSIYSMRTPPHPLITVCTNRPESWPLLQQQVHLICNHSQATVCESAVAILRPFLLYVLIDPSQQDHFVHLRYALRQTLFQQAQQQSANQLNNQYVSFLCSLLPSLQLFTVHALGEAVQYMSDLLHLFAQRDECTSDVVMSVNHAMSICFMCQQKGLSSLLLLQKIHQIGKKWTQVFSTRQNIILLARMLFESDSDTSEELLQIATIHLSNCKTDLLHTILYGCLVLPVLHLMLAPQVSSSAQHTLQMAATSLIEALEKLQINNKECSEESSESSSENDTSDFPIAITEEAYECATYMRLCYNFVHGSASDNLLWMTNLQESLPFTDQISVSLTNVLASIFITPQCKHLSRKALENLIIIAKKDVRQASYFLPLLLYQMGREADPILKSEILKTLPQLAQHKACVGPILKSIQDLGRFNQLKPISLCLLTKLWTIQDRCFPQLHKALNEEPITRQSTSPEKLELLFAQASTIKEICLLRPVQHGADMLRLLSNILNVCTTEPCTAAVCLALEGLSGLCEAEVVSIQSVWKLLSTQLANDKRPAVTVKICEMFSLVPQLAVENEAFQKFYNDVVSMLWILSQRFGTVMAKRTDTDVSAASFKALSAFKAEDFNINHFPLKVTEDFRLQAEAMVKLKKEENPDITVESLLPVVPGVCYVRIIRTIQSEIQLNAYEHFLNSLVRQEVEKLPRGIYHSSYRKTHVGSFNQEKAVNEIPPLLLNQYEGIKQPGLRPGLAAGLLFAYNPVMNTSKGGQPKPHHVVSHGKNYQQMFSTLLHEVPVQPSEWHRTVLMPQAWVSFLDRLFSAMIESRHAEINLQIQHGHISEWDASEKKLLAWLWVRDTLTDTIKNVSRGNPTMQANSMLALSGLVCAVAKYRSGEDMTKVLESEAYPAHMKYKQWVSLITDSILSIWNVKYKPTGNALLGLCQQRSVSDRAAASMLCQASACLAIPRMISCQLTTDTSFKLFEILTMMTSSLPGQPNQPESPVLLFHNGLSLGMLLARLFEEHFSEIGGSKGMQQVWESLDALENCCLDEDLPNRSGSVLGLGLALSALCEDGKPESRERAATSLNKLFSHLKDLDTSSNIFQVLCFSVACISGSTFAGNIIKVETVDNIMAHLKELSYMNPQMSGVNLALGTLCYCLNMVGHSSINQLTQDVCTEWSNTYIDAESPTLHRISALAGLMALVGSERSLITIHSIPSLSGNVVNPVAVLQLAKTVLKSQEDIGIQSASAWMLGHVHLSTSTVSEAKTSVPNNYRYLDNNLIIRALIDFLIDAGKLGPDKISSSELKLSLTAIYKGITRPLPPLNWAAVLAPLLRQPFNSEVKYISLKVAISQCTSSSTAAVFLSSWLNSSLFNSLDMECQNIIFDNLEHLIKCIPIKTLQDFMEYDCMNPFLHEGKQSQCPVILRGLHKALLVNDPPEFVTELLYKTTENLYRSLTPTYQPDTYNTMCECLSALPDNRFDALIEDDFSDTQLFLKGTYTRCFLIANGKQPIALLNYCIDAIINAGFVSESLYNLSLMFLAQTFYRCALRGTENMECLQWFLELLGHTRNLAIGVIKLSDDVTDPSAAFDFAIRIVCAAACSWVNTSVAAAVAGQHPLFMADLVNNNKSDVQEFPCSVYLQNQPDFWLHLMPSYISRMNKEPWKPVLPKFMDWLIILHSLPDEKIKPSSKQILKCCLYMLRHTQEFKKPSVLDKVF